MPMEVMRCEEEWQRAAAYSVRIQGMARAHHIPLRDEIDENDGPKSKYIVLFDDVYPVATARFYDATGGSAVIGRIVVMPEYRGRGLGKTVVEESEKWLRELGYVKAIVESRVEVTGFYESMGYRFTGEEEKRGTTFTCIRMVKTLS